MERKKDIVVTGANGYIGHNVVRCLLDCGFDVTAVDMNNNNIDKRANFININLENLFGYYNVCCNSSYFV